MRKAVTEPESNIDVVMEPNHCNFYIVSGVKDIRGRVIEKTPQSHRYNFDTYTSWMRPDFIPVMNVQKPFEKMGYVYSDRLYGWDSTKHDKCCQEVWGNVGQYFDRRSPESIEKFLSLYFEKPIELLEIEHMCNVAYGTPIWGFRFRELEAANGTT